MLEKFLKALQTEVDNKSCYCWGAQGELATEITEAWIRKRENSEANAKRAIAFWSARLKAGYKNMRMFDCSGLGVYYLIKLGLRSGDTNANGLMSLCEKLTKDKLQKGDWVFRVYTSGSRNGKAYHIGYVVDRELNVIEAKGRDDGVVKRSLNAGGAGYWNAFGRPSYFKKEIEASIEDEDMTYIFTKVLRMVQTSPIPIDAEVKNLQVLLKKAGFSAGSLDGKFGKGTYKAVKNFQASKKLTIDGIAGEKTIKALGGKWKPTSYESKTEGSRLSTV
jgi:hypothetical protein